MKQIDMLQTGGYEVLITFESGVQVAKIKRGPKATMLPAVAGELQKAVIRDVDAAAQHIAAQIMSRLAEVYAGTKPLAEGEREEDLIAKLQMALGKETTNDGCKWADLLTAEAPAKKASTARTPVMA